jgi:endo-1,3(4)-beta-glucanase
MSKHFLIFLLITSLLLIGACQSKDDELDDFDELEPAITFIDGLNDKSIIQYDYFNPLQDVIILNEKDENINHMFNVTGNVNYGEIGTYELTYKLTYGNDSIEQSRIITVESGSITRSQATRNQLSGQKVNLNDGSYSIGNAPSIAHPPSPRNIDRHLLSKAVPSNSWWTSLLVQNYGGGNGIYTNPLRSAFSNFGAEITNPGAGFVQYWNPDGFNTMANFSLALPDMYLKSSALNTAYETHVVDYSDTTVKVAMRNQNDLRDHMVLTYAQGSPYIFAEVANKQTPYLTLATQGVAGFEFYTLEGNKIQANTYQGNAIVIRYLQKHVGYITSRPQHVGQPVYDDRYFLISTPDNSTFTISNNQISINLAVDNYFSIAALNDLADASFFHQHAYNKTLTGNVSYQIDHKNSIVETTYEIATQQLKSSATDAPIQYLMPHHYLSSDAELTQYEFETVRGFLKLMIGHQFTTRLSFHGVLPAMTLPQNPEFSEIAMATYLQDLNTRTAINDTSNFLNDEGPYWNSKALYPLAQGLIIADQINDENLKLSFISKLRHILTDWFTFTSTQDKRYLHYNEAWGATYYSNNDFNTASELSDHAFTHGYLVYASSVLSMYDPTFYNQYGQMVDLLLNGYMHPYRDSYDFAHLRTFDPWAGHTWAHGFGTFAEGNNLESSSEAINSWVGGYLWALQKGDHKLRDAAIYGFVHELQHAKIYMFDYEDIVFKDEYNQYASVAGMVWGGKYDYATWFGANPTFIYGIQWLPNGEYLSSYALNAQERNTLNLIYNDYLKAKNQTIDTWFANMWSIQALLDSTKAISDFDANKILNDDYPSDLAQTYYLLHGLKTYHQRTTTYTMAVHQAVASSIYQNQNGQVFALIWNPSDQKQTITFYDFNQNVIRIDVEPRSFSSKQLN